MAGRFSASLPQRSMSGFGRFMSRERNRSLCGDEAMKSSSHTAVLPNAKPSTARTSEAKRHTSLLGSRKVPHLPLSSIISASAKKRIVPVSVYLNSARHYAALPFKDSYVTSSRQFMRRLYELKRTLHIHSSR